MNCTTVASAVVAAPPPMQIIPTVVSDSCGIGQGSICINVVNGVAPFTYLLNNNLQGNNCFTNLPQGIYTVTVSDSNGCNSTTIVTLQNIIPFTASYSVVNSFCTSGSAIVSLNVTGNTGPYTYSDTAHINFITSIGGNYTNVITDINGCMTTESIHVNKSDSLKANLGVYPFQCGFDTIHINNYVPINGNNNVPTNYIVYDPIGSITNFTGYLVPSTGGIYTIVETTGYHCNDTTIIEYANGPLGMANTILTQPTCAQTMDGAITAVTATSNAIPIYSVYKTSSPIYSKVSTNPVFTNLGAGIYYVKIINQAGCQLIIDTLTSSNLSCGSISGFVNYDQNTNCSYDNIDPPMQNRMITLNPGNKIAFTNPNGYFIYPSMNYGSYTVTTSNSQNLIFTTCTNNIAATINNSNVSANVQFYDSLSPNVDYSISFFGGCLAPALSLINNTFLSKQILYHAVGNLGNVGGPVTIKMVMDSVQYFGSSIPAHSSINGDTIVWNNLPTVFANNMINISFNYPASTFGGPGQNLELYLEPNGADFNLANNQVSDSIWICTSYDPNDKQVHPANGYTKIQDSVFKYKIRFQNTGNAPAANVVIRDTLDTQLDITTFQVIGYSHPYTIEVENNSILVFKFMGILLPDSSSDFEGSQGFIAYSIETMPGVQAGDLVTNTANIYFDYNPAIVTNTTTNTMYIPFDTWSFNNSINTSCDPLCGNGSITAIIPGGVPPINISINSTCPNIVINGNLISYLKGGNYIITATDAIGYTQSSIVLLNEVILPPAVSTTYTLPFNGAGGSIQATPVGGIAPFTYQWTGSNCNTAKCENLTTGSYTVTITDANGCSGSTVVTFAPPQNIVEAEQFISIYPNPTADLLTITSSEAIGSAVLRSSLGEIIEIMVLDKNTTISLEKLSSGVYTLHTKCGVYKIQKQ